MLAGLGLNTSDSGQTLSSDTAWHSALKTPATLQSLDGHFAAVIWNGNELTCFTDSLGLRTLYYAKLPQGGVVFSTRLDWICKLTQKTTINFQTFGAQWLAFNQLDTSSPIEGIHRLGPGGCLRYQAATLSVQETPWIPSWNAADADAFCHRLETLVNPALPGNKAVSLGLSGGLDSRLLLALKYQQRNAVHTFGIRSHPDGKIAARIADALSLEHTCYHQPVESTSSGLAFLRSHVTFTQPMVPASAIPDLQHYSTLYTKGFAVIDGGWGELARRQFLNKLRIKGKKHVLAGNFEAATSFVLTPRPELFNIECMHQMHQGLVSQFSATWHALPSVNDIGFENALDLFSVRTRLPNFFGFEQNRLDGQGINYMPYAQPSLLDIIFGLPVKLRRNARLFRDIIRQKQPALTHFQLVKGHHSYPYRLSPAAAYLWTKLKSRSNPVGVSSEKTNFLKIMQPFILDTLQSAGTRQFDGYNIPLITNEINAFYGGDTSKAEFVDWWLSFEIWRQEISGI